MPHAGAPLEALVAQLERCLLPTGATLTAPDHLPDQTTGALREVDASIRYRLGTIEILVILECRDWNTTQGVQWIEQLAQKRNNLAIAKAVAVSTSGFTKPAKIMAARLGIDTREVQDITASAIDRWGRVNSVALVLPNYTIKGVTAEFDAKPGVPLPPLDAIPGDTRLLQLGGESALCSGRELWHRFAFGTTLWENVPTDGIPVPRRVRLTPVQCRVTLRWNDVSYPVRRLTFDVDLTQTTRDVPLHRVYSYMCDTTALVETAEYLINAYGTEEVLVLHNDLTTRRQAIDRRPLKPNTTPPEMWVRITDVPLDNVTPTPRR